MGRGTGVEMVVSGVMEEREREGAGVWGARAEGAGEMGGAGVLGGREGVGGGGEEGEGGGVGAG